MNDAPDFGFGTDGTDEPEPSNIIPFPRLRPNAALVDRWREAVGRLNQKESTRHNFRSPLDVVPKLIEYRKMAPMAWPADMPELGRRARLYPGDCFGLVGSIGGGKTSLGLQIALAHSGEGMPVLWAPLELDEPQILTRLAGNMHGEHSHVVRDTWTEERTRHALTVVDDMWRFVDRYDDVDKQFGAFEDAIATAWEVYKVPPLLMVDHLGELVVGRDEVFEMRQNANRLRKLAVDRQCFIGMLLQSSVSNQSILTGRTEPASAAELIGIETGGKAIASACAVNIGVAVYKMDDAPELDGRWLVSKARHTGLEGQVGARFTKRGGRWRQLDYLPTTPGAIAQAKETDKKDKHRIGPPRSTEQARSDLNAAAAGDAAAMRRASIYKALVRHGMLGMELIEVRKIQGAGRGPAVMQALHELQHAGSAELYMGRWRAITRMD